MMDHDSDGGNNTEEEAIAMKKSAKEERLMTDEYKEEARVKAEKSPHGKPAVRAGRLKMSKKSDYQKLCDRLGKCSIR